LSFRPQELSERFVTHAAAGNADSVGRKSGTVGGRFRLEGDTEGRPVVLLNLYLLRAVEDQARVDLSE